MFNFSSATNTSFGMPLDLGSSKKDLFNSSTSDFFDPPPPPGGPGGGGRSPLFDRPLYQLIPYQVIDLSFLREFKLCNDILNALGNLLLPKTEPDTKALPLFSKLSPTDSALSVKDFTQLPATATFNNQYLVYGAAFGRQVPPVPDIIQAARSGNIAALEAAYSQGNIEELKARDSYENTIAHQAPVPVLEWICSKPELEGLITRLNWHGQTPLHIAAAKYIFLPGTYTSTENHIAQANQDPIVIFYKSKGLEDLRNYYGWAYEGMISNDILTDSVSGYSS